MLFCKKCLEARRVGGSWPQNHTSHPPFISGQSDINEYVILAAQHPTVTVTHQILCRPSSSNNQLASLEFCRYYLKGKPLAAKIMIFLNHNFFKAIYKGGSWILAKRLLSYHKKGEPRMSHLFNIGQGGEWKMNFIPRFICFLMSYAENWNLDAVNSHHPPPP